MRSLGAKPIHILNRSMTAVARLVAVGELTKGPRWEHRQLSRRDAEQLSLSDGSPRIRYGMTPIGSPPTEPLS
jgi:hypothetical protein